jgi:hypothetical protein
MLPCSKIRETVTGAVPIPTCELIGVPTENETAREGTPYYRMERRIKCL